MTDQIITGPPSLEAVLGSAPQELTRAESVAVNQLRPGRSPRRAGVDPDHARMLAESGADLPPIIVHRASMGVVDGMHRLHAEILRGAETIAVRFFDGSDHDAFVLAVRANVTDGLPLPPADRSAAAERILGSHPHWSDRAIASTTGLTARTIASIRSRICADGHTDARVGRDGRSRPLSCAEGRRLAGEFLLANPGAPLRAVARSAGISIGTARDVRDRLDRGDHPVLPGRRRAVPVAPGPPGSTVVVPRPARPVAAALLASLTSDPSMRYASAGRSLVRMLTLHITGVPDWTGLGNAVPLHCAPRVAGVARECAQKWLDLADRLERRGATEPR